MIRIFLLVLLAGMSLWQRASAQEEAHLLSDSVLNAQAETVLKQLSIRMKYSNPITLRQVPKLNNAEAPVKDNIIKYDPALIRKCQNDPKAGYTLEVFLAHELAHFLNKDTNLLDCTLLDAAGQKLRQRRESDADSVAGVMLNRMCIPLDSAVMSFECLIPEAASGPCYFNLAMRLKRLSEGWINEDEDYGNKHGGQHRNDKYKHPVFGENSCRNKSHDAHAYVDAGRLLITYKVPATRKCLFPAFLATEPALALTPRPEHLFFRWGIGSEQPGMVQDTLIWNYGLDGYSDADILFFSDSLLGIAAFNRKKVPRFLHTPGYVLFTGGIVAGLGSVAYGLYLKRQACDLYTTYLKNLDPTAIVYTRNGAMSRQETYELANRKNTWYVGPLLLGAAAATVLNCQFIKRIHLNRCRNAMRLFPEPEGRRFPCLEVTTGVNTQGPSFGLLVHF